LSGIPLHRITNTPATADSNFALVSGRERWMKDG
jgi:hypothetical protein